MADKGKQKQILIANILKTSGLYNWGDLFPVIDAALNAAGLARFKAKNGLRMYCSRHALYRNPAGKKPDKPASPPPCARKGRAEDKKNCAELQKKVTKKSPAGDKATPSK